MDEKILIKSEVDKKLKTTLLILSICLLIFCTLSFVFFAFKIWEAEYYVSGYYILDYYVKGHREYTTISGYNVIFSPYYDIPSAALILCRIWFILACLSFIIGVPLLIAYFAMKKCSIDVTDKSVIGKTFFGKEVVLPMYMISAYSTRKFFSTIAVATSSGITRFALIKNYAEIGNLLSQKINERQDNTASTSNATETSSQSSSADDLKKFKELLDTGVITQEEFEAKKKQLLGL